MKHILVVVEDVVAERFSPAECFPNAEVAQRVWKRQIDSMPNVQPGDFKLWAIGKLDDLKLVASEPLCILEYPIEVKNEEEQ